MPFDVLPGGRGIVSVSADQQGIDEWSLATHQRTTHVPVAGNPVYAVVATPRAGQLVVARVTAAGVADQHLALQLWHVGGPRTAPVPISGADDLALLDATGETAVRALVGFDGADIVADGNVVSAAHPANSLYGIGDDQLAVTGGEALTGSGLLPLRPGQWVAHLCTMVSGQTLTTSPGQGLPTTGLCPS